MILSHFPAHEAPPQPRAVHAVADANVAQRHHVYSPLFGDPRVPFVLPLLLRARAGEAAAR